MSHIAPQTLCICTVCTYNLLLGNKELLGTKDSHWSPSSSVTMDGKRTLLGFNKLKVSQQCLTLHLKPYAYVPFASRIYY